MQEAHIFRLIDFSSKITAFFSLYDLTPKKKGLHPLGTANFGSIATICLSYVILRQLGTRFRNDERHQANFPMW